MTTNMKILALTRSLCNHLNKTSSKAFFVNVPKSNNTRYYKILKKDTKKAHAFIDKNTGDVYKASSQNHAPYKGVRFNIIKDITQLERVADPRGVYLRKEIVPKHLKMSLEELFRIDKPYYDVNTVFDDLEDEHEVVGSYQPSPWS